MERTPAFPVASSALRPNVNVRPLVEAAQRGEDITCTRLEEMRFVASLFPESREEVDGVSVMPQWALRAAQTLWYERSYPERRALEVVAISRIWHESKFTEERERVFLMPSTVEDKITTISSLFRSAVYRSLEGPVLEPASPHAITRDVLNEMHEFKTRTIRGSSSAMHIAAGVTTAEKAARMIVRHTRSLDQAQDLRLCEDDVKAIITQALWKIVAPLARLEQFSGVSCINQLSESLEAFYIDLGGIRELKVRASWLDSNGYAEALFNERPHSGCPAGHAVEGKTSVLAEYLTSIERIIQHTSVIDATLSR